MVLDDSETKFPVDTRDELALETGSGTGTGVTITVLMLTTVPIVPTSKAELLAILGVEDGIVDSVDEEGDNEDSEDEDEDEESGEDCEENRCENDWRKVEKSEVCRDSRSGVLLEDEVEDVGAAGAVELVTICRLTCRGK